MAWSVTFTEALVIFTAIMIPVYLVLLALSGKSARQPKKSTSGIALKIILVIVFLTEALVILLLHNPSFRTELAYFALTSLTAVLLLIGLRLSPSSGSLQTLILVSAVMYHIALLYTSPFGIAIHERSALMARFMEAGYWNVDLSLGRSVYNPFAMDVGVFSMGSIVTSIPQISQLKSWIILLSYIVAYDLVFYSLTKRATGSRVAGVLAVFMLASTPPCEISGHTAQWMGNFLALASALALIKAFEESSSTANIVMANTFYAVSVFFHPSAAMGAFLPLAILTVSYFMKRITSDKIWTELLKSRLFLTTFSLFIVITFARAIYTAGYLEAILPTLNTFVSTMIGQTTSSGAQAPLYDRTIGPINAYAWSTPVAAASALIIHALLKRRVTGKPLPLAMYFVGASFLLLGFLTAILQEGGFRRPMYPAYTYLIPAAAALGGSCLRSRRTVATVAIVSIALSASIALTDPMLNPEQYVKLGAERISPSLEEYVEACAFVNIIPSGRQLVAPYDMRSSFSYLEVVEGAAQHHYYSVGTSTIVFREKVLHPVIYDKEVSPIFMYIWPERWLPNIKSHLNDVRINIYSDSVRYTVFEKITDED